MFPITPTNCLRDEERYKQKIEKTGILICSFLPLPSYFERICMVVANGGNCGGGGEVLLVEEEVGGGGNHVGTVRWQATWCQPHYNVSDT